MIKNILKSLCASVVLCLSFIFAPYLFGQDKPKPFEGAAVAQIPENFSYELKILPAIEIAIQKWNSENSDKPQRQQIKSHRTVKWLVVKKGYTVLVKSSDEGGRESEVWIINGALSVKSSSGSYWAILPDNAGDSDYQIFSKIVFPYTEWININNFFAKSKWEGKEAFEFVFSAKKANIASAPITVDELPPGEMRAWVDVNTRLPLCIDKNGDRYIFKHIGLFSDELIVPDAARLAIERELSLQQSMHTPPPP